MASLVVPVSAILAINQLASSAAGYNLDATVVVLWFRYTLRASLGAQNPGGFPAFSRGWIATRKLAPGRINSPFGSPRHGGVKPYPRVSPGASAPHLEGPGGASPSRVASRREVPLRRSSSASRRRRRPALLRRSSILVVCPPRRATSRQAATNRRRPLLRPTLSPLLGPSPTSAVPRSRLTSPDPSQLERDKPATLPLPSAAGRTAPPGPRRS
ncbi:hypothetical protein PVAP13_6KG154618 [Panicum virgatum]|uniref:Uncharacterized protein n=1 Tax=Panicum virgatum TaxID=38727 RepID=A0A8T0RDU8_PANVG|nr:hypothetical protein PVAP13_6KG154618 [Panicum virgatum]